MAVTGMVWMGYVLAHMVGNLSMYLGETELNHYAEWFRTLATPALPRTVLLWLLRFVLIVAIVLHVHPGAFAAVDTIGNVSFPIAVLAGVIG